MSDRQKEKKETLKKRSKKTKDKRNKIKDKLTIDGLAELIREIMTEEGLLEVNPFHKSDGTWASKDTATTYSLSANNKFKDSELEHPARGTVTKSGKVSSKYGMNTGSPEKQCGKLNLKTGKKKTKTRSCKDYPENYSEGAEQTSAVGGTTAAGAGARANTLSSADTLYFKELIKQELEKYERDLEAKLQSRSRSSKKEGGCDWETFLRLNQQYVASQEPPKN